MSKFKILVIGDDKVHGKALNVWVKNKFGGAPVVQFEHDNKPRDEIVDLIIDNPMHYIIVSTGNEETCPRSWLDAECNYFIHYDPPHEHYSHRKDEVLAFKRNYLCDVHRPFLNKKTKEIIAYLKEHHLKHTDLGYANGWGEPPQAYKDCNHKPYYVNENRAGTVKQWYCDECFISWRVDSSD